MDEKILIVVAHSDDQIIGAGGTAAKYASEGSTIKTIIMFSGEETHPHFQENIIVTTRMKESLNADKVVGGKGVNFFNYTEMTFKDFDKATEKLVKVINDYKPTKILTHSHEDVHPGHKKVNKIVLNSIDKIRRKIDVYVFDIWNIFRVNKRKHPKLVVDISNHYSTKIKALKCFKSQFSFYGFMNIPALIMMYVRNLSNGIINKGKYAEVFYKIK